MNLLLFLSGLFFSIEGFLNVVFFHFFREDKTRRFYSHTLFQFGRFIRGMVGTFIIYLSLLV